VGGGIWLKHEGDLVFTPEVIDGQQTASRVAVGQLVEGAVAGELERWENSDRGLVALILLLDQFTRNIYRNTPAAFSGDARALDLAQRTIVAGHHQRLPAIHQVFLYMPLEHSENIDTQEECVTLFEELAAVTGHEQIENFCRYAVAHREVIEQFGRFPHRNAILGRESTPGEIEYLKIHGGF
jgi:uncharacterized protein (DUF924 family)